MRRGSLLLALIAACCLSTVPLPAAEPAPGNWLWSTAYVVPKDTTNMGSGYFAIVEGHNHRIYVGTAKYAENAYLVEFDPQTKQMRTVVDCQKEIGTTATGYAAQSKIHTRCNVGPSGKIYLATKQGIFDPKKGDKLTDYPGGYPMVFDPATGKTRVYPVPVPHQGIISITPDESRGVAYLSTCSDERPVESTHFLKLDLATGKYRDFGDVHSSYAFIVIDDRGRAYHPLPGGKIIRYDPATDKLEELEPTIDGQSPSEESLLASPKSHIINWEISPDRKTLYAIPMRGNGLYSYDLTAPGKTLSGKSLGRLISGKADCRAMCVGPSGTVWAAVGDAGPGGAQIPHLVRYRPGDAAPVDLGILTIRNPDYTEFTGPDGKQLPWHHGVFRRQDDVYMPLYVLHGVCEAHDGTVYVTFLYPLTLLQIAPADMAKTTASR